MVLRNAPLICATKPPCWILIYAPYCPSPQNVIDFNPLMRHASAGAEPEMSQIGQAPPPIHHNDLSHLSRLLIQGTCTSLAPNHPALHKHTPHSSQLSDLVYTKWTLITLRYYLHDTNLFVYLPPVPLHHWFPGYPSSAPLRWSSNLSSTIILWCVLLLVIHEFLARQPFQHNLSPLHQVSKFLLPYIGWLPAAEINKHCIVW